MKKLSFVLALSLLAVSCQNKNTEGQKASDNNMKMGSAQTVKPNAKVDPVCGMPQGDIAYTDFSVVQKDTVWFCSPHCKEQFDKDPAKYTKK
ncbi:MAG TPA: hypothetical protein VFL76_10055 [Edaphocola sp.]|nr:hypothetical protein [Edaphocola sp.]